VFLFSVKKSALYMDMFMIKILFMFLCCFVSLQRIYIFFLVIDMRRIFLTSEETSNTE
jgi:hypothetical protein